MRFGVSSVGPKRMDVSKLESGACFEKKAITGFGTMTHSPFQSPGNESLVLFRLKVVLPEF